MKKQNSGHRRQNTECKNIVKNQRLPHDIGITIISRGESAVNFYFLCVLGAPFGSAQGRLSVAG
jgi:hypothetical protein